MRTNIKSVSPKGVSDGKRKQRVVPVDPLKVVLKETREIEGKES